MQTSPIPELLAELAAGRMIILMDDEDRENEGDLVLAADCVTSEAINFMSRHACGLICLTLTRERCEQLRLAPMVARNGSQHGTAFTVSIESAVDVTTGISAADRARTVQAAVAHGANAGDLVQPGHIFPLQARDGGVLTRPGHTEAGCDMAAMAGLTPASVICEIMNVDGTMARFPDLKRFAKEHRLKIGTIADLIDFRRSREEPIERAVELMCDADSQDTSDAEMMAASKVVAREGVKIPLPDGTLATFFAFHGLDFSAEHFAVRFDVATANPVPLVRMHSECITGDLFGSLRCDCGAQLEQAVERLKLEGGILLYLRQEGRGIGLAAKLDAYRLQDQGMDTFAANRALEFPADSRDYECGADMLRALGISQVRLLSNNPDKVVQLENNGIHVVEAIPTGTFVTPFNRDYLAAKVDVTGHTLEMVRQYGIVPPGESLLAEPSPSA